MRTLFCLTLATAVALDLCAQPAADARGSSGSAAARAWQRYAAQSHATLGVLQQTDPGELPPALPGVADLKFAEFFGPIGDRGLEYSPRLRALDGGAVRLVGYMVREQEHAPGLFLLAGWPVRIETKGVCMIDSPPPSAVHVLVPAAAGRPVPYRPGRIVLCGRIELGPRLEADGRNSTIRLMLDPSAAAQFLPVVEPKAP